MREGPWAREEEVDEVLEEIREMMEREGSLTREMVGRCKRRMAGSTHDLICYFLKRLEVEAPGALIFFSDGYSCK